MSFDYNPFRHLEVVEVEPGVFQAYCHGCGGNPGPKMVSDAPIGLVRRVTIDHLATSHNRTEDDFKDWSFY